MRKNGDVMRNGWRCVEGQYGKGSRDEERVKVGKQEKVARKRTWIRKDWGKLIKKENCQ